ncbi:MAG: phosphodiesterase [Desulfovibrionaceae bacterium]|nr:phosphodiesterase [Desulfovibrionaceae bacterium]
MRILIASDLHGSLSSLHFLVQRTKELAPDLLVLLGDLVYHGPRNPLPEGYDTRSVLHDFETIKSLTCGLIAVKGNCDAEVDLAHLPFPVSENAWINADGLNLFASHGHRLPEVPPIPYNIPLGTVLLRGHTHIPRGETLHGFHFWNPGSLSLPKGGSQRSYGFYENGTFSVFTLEGHKVLEHTPKN